jgi:hypothetical protein
LKRSSTFTKTGNGGFIESCLEHVAAQGYKSNIIQINGVTMAKALSDWWDEDGATEGDDGTARGIHWHMPCDLHLSSPGQCNPSCQAAGSTTTMTPLPVTKLMQSISATTSTTSTSSTTSTKSMLPHIIFILIDDLGYCDYAWTGCNGSNVLSPHLSSLAANGTVLGNYYVNPICTPTRASLLTGRYPIHLGLQHGTIHDAYPIGVPMNETLLPELLKKQGYRTHIVGKWHLGFYQKQYTPEHRGFDTHYGYYTGNEEYWNHTSPCWNCTFENLFIVLLYTRL